MKKKNCYGCRALHGIGLHCFCSLGYNIEYVTVRGEFGHMEQPKPAEKCPKPRTYKELDNCEYKTILSGE